MKKKFFIFIILISTVLLAAYILDYKKQPVKIPPIETPVIKEPVAKKPQIEKKLDLSEVILASEEKKIRGNNLLKYTIDIINGYGDIKSIDMINVNIDKEGGVDKYLQKCMKDDTISVVSNRGKIPEEILNKIKNIGDFKLDRVGLDRSRKTNKPEDTDYRFYCTRGDGSGNLELLKVYTPRNHEMYITGDKDVKAILEYL